MSSVCNSYLNPKKLLQPGVFLGIAFLAGSRRLIQYIPGASKGGLLTAAFLSGGLSFLYDIKCHDPNRCYVIEKMVAIAVATLGTGLAAKFLKSRITLSLRAAATLGLVECVIVATFASVHHETSKKKKELDHLLLTSKMVADAK